MGRRDGGEGRGRRWMPYTRCMCFGCRDRSLSSFTEEEVDEEPRRGGISYQPTDKKAIYVRMIGDVKTQTKPELRDRSVVNFDPPHSLSSVQPLLSRSRDDTERFELERGVWCSGKKRRRESGGGTDDWSERLMDGERVKECTRRRHSISARAGLRVRHQPLSCSSRLSATNPLLDVYYTNQTQLILKAADRWNFNIFSLDQYSNGRSLFHLSLHLFHEYKFVQLFKLDLVKLMRCFSLIEGGYYCNSYHNSMHAADVVQAMHCNLLKSKMAACLTDLEMMSAILSAAGHDLYHPGANQAFLIATHNPLALLYQNTSVLENHHWQSLVSIMHESRAFEHLPTSVLSEMKTQTQAMILATDITRQQEILSTFRNYLDRNSLNVERNSQHRTFVLQIALKCADVGNPCRPWPLCKRWGELICEEFFNQGDRERELALPISPSCDRTVTTVAKIQQGFIAFIVEPLFSEWNRFADNSHTSSMLKTLAYNKDKWHSIDISESSPPQQQHSPPQQQQPHRVTVTIVAECSPPSTAAGRASISSSASDCVSSCSHTVSDCGATALGHVSCSHTVDDCGATLGHVNSALHLDELDDKENAEPSEVSDQDCHHQVGFDPHARRHSLPTDVVTTTTCVGPNCGSVSVLSARCNRRFSLPNTAVITHSCSGSAILSPSPPRLSSLVECSSLACPDHPTAHSQIICTDLNCAVTALQRLKESDAAVPRRCSLDANLSCQKSVLREYQPSLRRHSELAQTSTLEQSSAGKTRHSVDLPRPSHCVAHNCAPLYNNLSCAKPSTKLLHPNCGLKDWQCSNIRRSSYTAGEENTRGVNSQKQSNNRKRSSSLATASVAPVSSDLRVSRGGLIKSPCSHHAVLLETLTPSSRSKESNSTQRGNGRARISAPGGAVKQTKLSTGDVVTTVHSNNSTPMTRLVDVHYRPPKGVSRRAATVVSAAALNDGEVIPLLQEMSDLHDC